MVDNYQAVCTVAVDTSSVKPDLEYSEEKKSYYCLISFEVVLLFGLTELKAQIAYCENVRSGDLPRNACMLNVSFLFVGRRKKVLLRFSSILSFADWGLAITEVQLRLCMFER